MTTHSHPVNNAGHSHGHEHGHNPHLQHHFDTLEQQFNSGKLGMWLFLATEVLLFGGLFVAYALYRALHPEIYEYGHHFLDTNMGAINTAVLILSSFTMAASVRFAQEGKQGLLRLGLILTLLGASGFLVIKYFEYSHKMVHGVFPGKYFAPDDHILHETFAHGGHSAGDHDHPAKAPDSGAAQAMTPPSVPTADAAAAPVADGAFTIEKTQIAPAALGPAGLADPEVKEHGIPPRPEKAHVFFGIYYLMTGLHGVHVVVGMIAILWVLIRSMKGEFGPGYFTPVDLVGLYWHLVDLIWIFLFPLLYLIH